MIAVVSVLVLGGGGDGNGGGQTGGGGGGATTGGGETETGPPVIDVPDAPNSLALSDDIVWVSTRAGTVGIPPGQDKELIERGRDATQGGRAVGEQGDVLWVPIPEENKVVSLSARTGAPRTATITTANRPKALAFTDDQVLVSESDGAATRVERYDANSGDLITGFNVANGVERITLRGDTLWVLTSGPDFLNSYNATGTLLTSTEVGEGAKSMVFSGGFFWVTGSKDGSLTRVDEKTQDTKTFDLGGSPQNVRVGLGAVWVTNATEGALQGLDPDTGDINRIPVGSRPFSLVLAEDGIWVGDTADDKVRFVKP